MVISLIALKNRKKILDRNNNIVKNNLQLLVSFFKENNHSDITKNDTLAANFNEIFTDARQNFLIPTPSKSMITAGPGTEFFST